VAANRRALVRQMPGSAKGVMFITIEDAIGIANLVIWPKLYERQRRIILLARMMAVHGRIQRKREVVGTAATTGSRIDVKRLIVLRPIKTQGRGTTG
jgi:DNA polymerase III alpha subunit